MDPSTMLGPIDLLAPYITYLIMALVVVNMATRHRQHGRHKAAVRDGEEELSRWLPHTAMNVLLILATFYFLSIDYHGGVVLGVLVLGLVITDFFEIEARQVEARNGRPLDAPKASIVASGLVLLYAFYLSLFFLIEPVWSAIV